MASQTQTETGNNLDELKYSSMLTMCADYKKMFPKTVAFLVETTDTRKKWTDNIQLRLVLAITKCHIALACNAYDKYLRAGRRLDDELKDCLTCSYAKNYQRKINDIYEATGSYNNEYMVRIMDKFTPDFFIKKAIELYGNNE